MATESAGAPVPAPAPANIVDAMKTDVEKDVSGVFGFLKTGFGGAFTTAGRAIAITWGLIGVVAGLVGVKLL